MKIKFYVVFVGRNPGVYTTWMDCNREVSGYPRNLHCSFASRDDAEKALLQFQANASMAKTHERVPKEFPIEKKVFQVNVKDCLLGFLIATVIIQVYFMFK